MLSIANVKRFARRPDIYIAAFLGCLTLTYGIATSYYKASHEGVDVSLFLEFSLQNRDRESSDYDLPFTQQEKDEFRIRQLLLSSYDGRSMSSYETPRRFVPLEETLGYIKGLGDSLQQQTFKKVNVTEYSAEYNLMHKAILHRGVPRVVEGSMYVRRPPNSLKLNLGSRSSQWQPKSQNLTRVSEYFSYLHTPQAHCRKLVRFGGNPMCKSVGDDYHMDGNKLICLDPEFELPGGKDPANCLVFSYGIHTDSSFDETIAALPCEIHMFDIFNFTPSQVLQYYPHSHFHQIGISTSNMAKFYTKLNTTIKVDTLINQVVKNNLIGRPMHILKVDIEGGEWDTLQSLKGNPFLELIGQIAIEVHASGLLSKNMTSSDKLQYARQRYDTLRLIENHGFRMVAYWDNLQPEAYYDESGTRHDVCGEMLYTNTNWYNSTFKKTLKDKYGFKFKATT
ncbi:uncharacterized protein LOC135210779 isoform X1 [Macrobrachium nipponense]|uniref:uncharacterized protein LOC135210779 isoform X1 n=1 Tax=Macrobrachium nipponense TaxID=159736 RepID=UPI0030C80C6E